MKLLPLTDLKPGMSGVVKQLEGEESFQKRLADLGVVPGTPILFVRRAPFGDPVEVTLRGYRLALRGSDAKKILLEV